MSTLQVSLFGRLKIQRNGIPLTDLDSGRVPELLCYLLLHQDRHHPRENLASVLWGDTPTAQARKYLRQALWQLQMLLDADVPTGEPRLLEVEPDWVRINPGSDLWLDVAAFQHSFNLVRGTPGDQMTSDEAAALRESVGLYQGDLLDGWYQDWCLLERERLLNLFLSMLDKLMAYCESTADYESGFAYGERILRQDRARERTHRQMMRLHYLSGDRTAALRQYERCIAALQAELDVKPSRRTIELCQQIRAEQLETPARRPADSASAPSSAHSLHQILDQLRRVQAMLTESQYQLQQQIRAVEQDLSRRD